MKTPPASRRLRSREFACNQVISESAALCFVGRVERQQHLERAMQIPESDLRRHTQNMKQRLSETMNHLREDIAKVDEPQFKAMAETAAEVLGGLIKAFDDYERKNEQAWRQ